MHCLKSMESRKIKVFVDTNVLLDFIIPSRPGHSAATDLFTLILASKIETAFSIQSFLDASYICRRYDGFSEAAFRKTLSELLIRTNVANIDTFDLSTAIKDSNEDMEDNAQIAFAYNQCCDIFLTGDKGLFSRKLPSPMRVMTVEEFVGNCRA